jgi:hypothetical protein
MYVETVSRNFNFPVKKIMVKNILDYNFFSFIIKVFYL